MGFPLGKEGDQHVGAGHFIAAGGLDVNGGALQDPLEARRRLGILQAAGDQRRELVVEVVEQLAAQAIEVDSAGAEHRDRILILDKRQQQMLQRRIFVTAFVGIAEGVVQALLQVGRQHGPYSFSIVHCRGCWHRHARSTT